MSPNRKATRNRREGEGTPSRHSRLGARAAALIVLGGVAGLSSAPMAHAAAHDSLKTFRSSGTFTVAKDDAGVDAAEDRSEARDEAEDRSEARDEAEDRSEARDEAE
ncbi:hypothetical protein AB0D42_41110, partial [Streptomyces sp. NPDC048304]|uniref:hypothetical protein n=1 Tax=Streptomyces sp. NPDC048304 TaxID=3154820 RepID=UPI0033F740B0